MGVTETCDKNKKRHPCGPVAHSPECCPACGKKFQRCEAHGGAAGARKSLGSHKGIEGHGARRGIPESR